MNHSYEEIRDIILDLLSGREKAGYEVGQYEHLAIGVAEVFKRRGDGQQATVYGNPQLDV